MATEIDKRVVEMQFDNKDFEKNCQASLTTLEKLKMALNFDGAKGLESMGKAANKIDFSNLSKGADAISMKFSAMQVAGMTMISELTKSFMQFGKNVWNQSLGQIRTGGWARTLKMDQAKFQMKALADNMDDVKNGLLDTIQVVNDMIGAANRAVDGTAYGLDAASAVASQLMASGLTNAEKMYNHLRAIAGAASMTGRSYEDIGNIFTTVASNGRLMTMQLRQFSAAGLNLSATLAQSAKFAGKTEDQINEMVTKGKISFQDFSDALYDAFGEAAGKADETWSGVTSNVRAQLSKIGQIFTDPFVENFIPVLATVKQKLKDIRSVLTPISNTWKMLMKFWSGNINTALDRLDMARLQPIANGIENILASLIMVVGTVRRAFMEMFPPETLEELHTAANLFEAMTRKLIPSKETLDGFKEVVKAFLIPLKLAFDILKSVSQNVMKPLALAFAKLLGSILKVGNAIAPVVESIAEAIEKSEFFGNVLKIISDTLIVVLEAVSEFFLAFNEVLGKFVNSQTFNDLLRMLKDIAHLLSSLIIVSLNLIFSIIKNIFSIITKENIVKVIEGIGNALSFLLTVIGLAVRTVINFIDYIANSGTVLGNIFRLIKDIFQLIKDFISGKDTSGSLDRIKSSIDAIVSSIKSLFNTLYEEMRKLPAGKILVFAFAVMLVFLTKALIDFVNASTKFVKKATSFFGIFDSIKKAITNIGKFTPVFQAMIGIVLIISAVTTSLVTLSKETEPDRLIAAAVALGVLSAGLMALALGMQWLTKFLPENDSKGLSAIMKNLLAIAGSVLMLTVAMKILSTTSIDLKVLAGPLLAVLLLIAALTKASVKLAEAAKDGFKGSLAMLTFAATILILVEAFKKLYALNMNLSNLIAATSALIVVIGLMATLGLGMYLVGKSGITSGAGIAFLGFSLSLLVIVGVLKRLAAFNYDEMESAFARLALLMTPIIGFILAAIVAVKVTKSQDILKDLASMLLAFNATILLMMVSVGILGSFKLTTLVKGIAAVHFLASILSAVTQKLLKAIFDTKGIDYKLAIGEIRQLNKLILATSAAMVLLALAAKIVDTVNIDAIIDTGVLFGLVGWWLTRMVEFTAKTKDAKMGPMIAVITSMAFIIASLAILSFQDPVQLAAAGLAIGLALAGLAAVMAFVNGKEKPEPKDADTVKKTNKSVLLICLGISGMILALSALGYVSKSTESSQIPVLEEMLIALAGLLVAVAAFTAIAGRVGDEKMANNAKSIAKIMFAMSGAMVIIAMAVGGLALLSNYIGEWSFFHILWSIGAIGAMCYAIIKVMNEIMGLEFKRDQKNRSSLYKAANTFVIFSAGLVIIAGAIAGLTATLASLKGWSIPSIILGVASIGVMCWAIVKSMESLIKSENELKKQKSSLIDVGISMAIASSSLIAISAALSGLIAVMGAHPVASIFHIVAAVAAIGVLAAVIFFAFSKIIKTSAGIDRSAILRLSEAMVIAASSMAVIAGSISLLATVMQNISSPGAVGKSMLAILALFVPLILGLIGVVAISSKLDSDNLKGILHLFIAMTAVFLVIAGVIAALSFIKIKDIKAFQKTVNALSKIMTIMVVFVGAITALVIIYDLITQFIHKSDDESGEDGGSSGISKTIMSIAAMFIIVAAAFALITLAITSMMKTINQVNPRDVDKAKNILLLFTGLLAAILALSGLIAGLGAGLVGDGFATALLAVAGVMVAFSVSLLAISKAIEITVDAVEKLNTLKVDKNKLRSNISDSLNGITQGILDAVPNIMKVFTMILAAIGIALMVWKYKAIMEVVAVVIGIIVAIKELLPVVLPWIADILRTIVEYLEEDENLNMWVRLAEKIGELLTGIIIGFIKGMFKELNEAIDEFVDKHMSDDQQKLKNQESTYKASKQNVELFEKQVATLESLGYTVEYDEKLLDDYKKKLEGIYNASRYDDAGRKTDKFNLISDMQWDTYSKDLEDLQNRMFESDGSFKMKLSLATQDMVDYNARTLANMTKENWVDVIQKLNHEMYKYELEGVEYNKDLFKNMAAQIGVPAEYMKYLGTEFLGSGTRQAILDDIENGNNQLVASIQKTRKEYVEEAKETVAEVEKVEEDSYEFNLATLKEKGEEMKGTMEDIIGTVSEVVTGSSDVTEGLMNGLADALPDIQIGDFNVKDLASQFIDWGGETGTDAGNELGENFINTVDWWIQEGKTKIATNLQAFQNSGGMSGFEYKYQKEGFDDVNSYAEAMVKQHEAMDETTESVSFADKALQAFYGITGMDEEAVKGLTGGLGDASKSMGVLGDSADKTKSKLEEFKDGVKDSIAQAMHGIFDEVSEQEYIDPEEMLYRMEENTRRVGEWARNIAVLAARGMSEGLLNELKDMGPQGAAKVQAFVDMTDEQLKMANRRWNAANFLPDYGTKEIEQSYRDAGFNASLGFTEGIDHKAVNEAGIQTGKDFDEGVRDYLAIESPSKVMEKNGEYATQGLAKGMINPTSQMFIRAACNRVGQQIVNGVQQSMPKNKFVEMGTQMMNGLPEGWNKILPSILSKATALAAKILAAFSNAWRINSPSRAFAEIGEYAMAGLGEGFKTGEPEVDDQVTKTSDDILNQMKSQIAAITNGWSEDNVYQPVIRPVFDMESIQTGYNDIQSWFANAQGLNLSGNLTRLTPTTTDDSASNQQIIDAINNINNDDVVREIGNLRSDILDLQSAMTNLQVVMNTGALVGQLVDPIDSALGMKSLMNTRGRY